MFVLDVGSLMVLYLEILKFSHFPNTALGIGLVLSSLPASSNFNQPPPTSLNPSKPQQSSPVLIHQPISLTLPDIIKTDTTLTRLSETQPTYYNLYKAYYLKQASSIIETIEAYLDQKHT